MTAARNPRRPNVKIGWVRIGDMTPDHAYQRDRKAAKVTALADAWDDRKVGAIMVNELADGTILINDGGHRWEAARRRFGEDYQLPAVINLDLDGPSSAEVFDGVNTHRTAVSRWDSFRIALNGGREPAVSIEATLQKRKMGVSQTAGPNRIGAVGALLRIESAYGVETLGLTVDVLEAAFGREASTWDADALQAVAHLIGMNRSPHHNVIVLNRLVTTLQVRSLAQWRVRSAAMATTSGGSVSRSMAMARTIAHAYNAGLRAPKRLIAPKTRA